MRDSETHFKFILENSVHDKNAQSLKGRGLGDK